MEKLQRETPSCDGCGSTVRARSIIDILARTLFGESMPLPEFPTDRGIRGVGLSDWEGYARTLANKLNYTNTYYHKDPRLDISAEQQELPEGQLDFLISSDVFEHIAPYSLELDTVEHFPGLYQYEILERGDRRVLRNITRDAREQIFKNLVFHGGEGETLEMRIFSETAVLKRLENAGFQEITVHREPCFKFGIYQPEPWSLPISARTALSE